MPVILSIGSKEYAKVGVPGNTGTKIFSLVGKIRNTGLVEVPMGTTISEIVYEIGGGSPTGARIKAVQTGGPSGGCIPASMFDLPIDYESLAKVGSIMGSGGMIVMDENTCMVDIAKYYMKFLMEESCGKCYTCRKGTQRMYEILDDISKGNGTLEMLALLEELAYVVRDTTMCGLGQTAPNPVLSTLKYFRDEYIEHIIHKNCPAGVCTELVGSPCQHACPLGTEVWRYVAQIQREEFDEAYKTIRRPNPLPSVCARVCNHPCEDKCRAGTSGGDPIAIRTLKRFVTDTVDPSVYSGDVQPGNGKNMPEIAVVGAGPAGLTGAHYLSLKGYRVNLFEAEEEPGGMLTAAIPEFRLPRKALKKEINALLTKSITFHGRKQLGKDFSLEDLLKQGNRAVFVALGAHTSRKLNIENEDIPGVIPSIEYLKSFNLHNENLAKGNVGILGGGNSAIDSARVALRQMGVKSVTLYYRRTDQEMPAFPEEIEAAIEEGVVIKTLVSPVRILSKNGRLAGVEFQQNKLGDYGTDGRRKPVPVPGSEFTVDLDTLIVAIGEQPAVNDGSTFSIDLKSGGRITADKHTLETNVAGVFAGGDAVTGPNTVVDAIAAGKRAAAVIDRFLNGEELIGTPAPSLPDVVIESNEENLKKYSRTDRVRQPELDLSKRKQGFDEVESNISFEDAVAEAGRCLRCDLEFARRQSGNDTTREKNVREENYDFAENK